MGIDFEPQNFTKEELLKAFQATSRPFGFGKVRLMACMVYHLRKELDSVKQELQELKSK